MMSKKSKSSSKKVDKEQPGIKTDAVPVINIADTSAEAAKSYFKRCEGAAHALLSFVAPARDCEWVWPTDEYVQNFINSFCSEPEISLGVDYLTPNFNLEQFSSNIDLCFARSPRYLSDHFADETIEDRIALLDRSLLKRYLPKYRMPWREESPVYWHAHCDELLMFIMRNPLLERGLRKTS